MKYKTLRYIAYVLEIIVFFFVQQVPNSFVSIYGVKPVLLIPISTTIAVFESETAAIGFGTLCGFLMDYGLSGTIGLNTFVLPIICYFLSLLSVNVIKTNLLTSMLTSFLIVILILGVQFIFHYLFKEYRFYYYILFNKCLKRALLTWLMVPFFYFFNKSFSLHIVTKE